MSPQPPTSKLRFRVNSEEHSFPACWYCVSMLGGERCGAERQMLPAVLREAVLLLSCSFFTCTDTRPVRGQGGRRAMCAQFHFLAGTGRCGSFGELL